MSHRVLITGSHGLVGTALREVLPRHGFEPVGFDIAARGREHGDVRDAERVAAALAGCHGVIHLAAISRVVWGEQDPENCIATNFGGLRNVLEAVERSPTAPWLLFSSSREVYGQPSGLPVAESAPLAPLNTYGRTKADGEELVESARDRGLRAAVVRLSNVYGRTTDHVDRVVPAFARAAVVGDPLRVDGRGHTFDFTHLDDTIRGLVSLAERMRAGDPPLSPLHLVTGVAVTLGELADLTISRAGSSSQIVEAPPRDFDVSRFVGDPTRAREVLGWSARIAPVDGIGQMVEAFRSQLGLTPQTLEG